MSQSENALRSSSLKALGLPRVAPGRMYRFERLMTVSFRHAFYNASGNLCTDFTVAPTAWSADQMASLGLLFRPEISGFSVMLDQRRRKSFLDYLRNQPVTSPAVQGWNRLSFAISVRNPEFINITDMPIDTSAQEGVFFLSNMAAVTQPHGVVRLNPGSIRPADQIAVTGSQFRWTVRSPRARRVVVRNIADETVACEPVYWPRGAPNPKCPGSDPQSSDAERRDVIYLNFSSLPEDKYEIEECSNLSGGCGGLSRPVSVAYTFSTAPPLFFIDLLFANPGIATGVYPVRDLDDEARTKIVPVDYRMEFRTRSTIWNYYIISAGEPLTRLEIDNTAPDPERPVTFTGPKAVTLPNDQPANLFVSDSAIPLQEQSDYNFQLLGQAGGLETRTGILLSRLPVASGQQVIPRKGKRAAAPPRTKPDFSDIYVYV
jgi:hypothetical protein